jgi:hypothetical protein
VEIETVEENSVILRITWHRHVLPVCSSKIAMRANKIKHREWTKMRSRLRNQGRKNIPEAVDGVDTCTTKAYMKRKR